MPYLSVHFHTDEFSCPCCQRVDMDMELINALERVREAFKKPVRVTEGGGYRCSRYNLRIRYCPECEQNYHGLKCLGCGGWGEQRSAKWSRHRMGTEADIVIAGVDPEEVASFCEHDVELRRAIKNIGRYWTFTHIGVGGHRGARWDNRRKGKE